MGNHTKNWKEFRKTGLFVFVNVFLQMFGWSIVIEINKKGKVESVYPKRVTYNGFPEKTLSDAYLKVKNFIGFYEKEEIEFSDDEDEVLEEELEISREEMLEQASINSNIDCDEYKKILEKVKSLREDKLAEEKLNGTANTCPSRFRTTT